jgi:hypothetical protein
VASEPPSSVVDNDNLFESDPGQGRFRRSCLTVAAALVTAGGLMVGCTALVLSRMDDMEFGIFGGDWDFSGFDTYLACDALDQARTDPNALRAADVRSKALHTLEQASTRDLALAEAFRKGYFGVEAWCDMRMPD